MSHTVLIKMIIYEEFTSGRIDRELKKEIDKVVDSPYLKGVFANANVATCFTKLLITLTRQQVNHLYLALPYLTFIDCGTNRIHILTDRSSRVLSFDDTSCRNCCDHIRMVDEFFQHYE
jgi:hypothetical protein